MKSKACDKIRVFLLVIFIIYREFVMLYFCGCCCYKQYWEKYYYCVGGETSCFRACTLCGSNFIPMHLISLSLSLSPNANCLYIGILFLFEVAYEIKADCKKRKIDLLTHRENKKEENFSFRGLKKKSRSGEREKRKRKAINIFLGVKLMCNFISLSLLVT